MEQPTNTPITQPSSSPLPEIDFWASPVYGEVTCPATPAHNDFLRRLKKGLACIVLFLMTSMPALAQRWGDGPLYEMDTTDVVDTTKNLPIPDDVDLSSSFGETLVNILLVAGISLVILFLMYCLFMGHRQRMKRFIAPKYVAPVDTLNDDQCSFELRITNDLGDTIAPGDSGMSLAARVVKRDGKGNEVTDLELTRRIVAHADGFLLVGEQQMERGKMVAYLSTSNAVAVPQTTWVAFSLVGQAERYTARIHFKVEA